VNRRLADDLDRDARALDGLRERLAAVTRRLEAELQRIDAALREKAFDLEDRAGVLRGEYGEQLPPPGPEEWP
jgi:hypothetical protein